jgi:hypothetical protein
MTTKVGSKRVAGQGIGDHHSPGCPGTPKNDFLSFLDVLAVPLKFEGGPKVCQ